MNKLIYSLLFAFALTIPLSYAAPAFAITLTQISTTFNTPIGIDYHEPSNKIVMSIFYPTGSPYNFETVASDGTHAQFSAVSGFTDEVKIASVRSGNVGGFTTGDLFTGNGNDGEIVRISANGATVTNPWVSLPGAGNGLVRGSLYVDRTGVYGGDLIAVTTIGEVWRITSAGVPTQISPSVDTHLEGVITVPNNLVKYGPLAGKIIAGAEQQGRLYIFDNNGLVNNPLIGVEIEDIDLIPANENFYGVNIGTSKLLGAPASEFATLVDDILLTQEVHPSGTSGLYTLFWDGSNLVTSQLIANGAPVGQWEHVTFSPAGLKEIPPVVAVGGEIIPINSVALLVAGAQSSSVWLISVLGLAAGLGIIFLRKRIF